jgi:hypothetical protein
MRSEVASERSFGNTEPGSSPGATEYLGSSPSGSSPLHNGGEGMIHVVICTETVEEFRKVHNVVRRVCKEAGISSHLYYGMEQAPKRAELRFGTTPEQSRFEASLMSAFLDSNLFAIPTAPLHFEQMVEIRMPRNAFEDGYTRKRRLEESLCFRRAFRELARWAILEDARKILEGGR